MTIPESQLAVWSKQGATVGSANTHTSLKTALVQHRWPTGMSYTTYLQGSYSNATNIRGNSDVDLVVECRAVQYSNLTEAEKRHLAIQPGAFGWADFRREVIAALVNYYGTDSVKPSNKSVKVLPDSSGNRLPADVVPCIKYVEYKNGNVYGEGITFWAQNPPEQIKNFPKHHLENGSAKNSSTQTDGWYKPSVRMFKNARERIIGGNGTQRKQFPSYFVECLQYNVPNELYGSSYQSTYFKVIDYLGKVLLTADSDRFVCQNYKRWLFGPGSTQWNKSDAQAFVANLVHLWDSW
jgi:hypothetical protein